MRLVCSAILWTFDWCSLHVGPFLQPLKVRCWVFPCRQLNLLFCFLPKVISGISRLWALFKDYHKHQQQCLKIWTNVRLLHLDNYYILLCPYYRLRMSQQKLYLLINLTVQVQVNILHAAFVSFCWPLSKNLIETCIHLASCEQTAQTAQRYINTGAGTPLCFLW
jgi:hypothetical protein